MAAFDSLYASQYDQLYSEKNYVSECDLIEEAISRGTKIRPTNVLDIGCGTGGHTFELARRGFNVTGVDLSKPMLNLASEKAQSLPTKWRPTFIHGDARNFDLGQTYDLTIMMFAVVSYLTSNEDVLLGLRNIRRHLRSGGLFVCDFWYGPSVLSVRPTDRVRDIASADGRVLRAASTTLDVQHHTADVSFKLWSFKEDRLISTTTEVHKMRYFFPQEFELFLSESGFSVRSFSAFPSLTAPLSDTTWNALVVAQAE